MGLGAPTLPTQSKRPPRSGPQVAAGGRPPSSPRPPYSEDLTRPLGSPYDRFPSGPVPSRPKPPTVSPSRTRHTTYHCGDQSTSSPPSVSVSAYHSHPPWSPNLRGRRVGDCLVGPSTDHTTPDRALSTRDPTLTPLRTTHIPRWAPRPWVSPPYVGRNPVRVGFFVAKREPPEKFCFFIHESPGSLLANLPPWNRATGHREGGVTRQPTTGGGTFSWCQSPGVRRHVGRETLPSFRLVKRELLRVVRVGQ